MSLTRTTKTFTDKEVTFDPSTGSMAFPNSVPEGVTINVTYWRDEDGHVEDYTIAGLNWPRWWYRVYLYFKQKVTTWT